MSEEDYIAPVIKEMDSEGLQCPLCSHTSDLTLTRLSHRRETDEGTRQNRYRFSCRTCDTVIFFSRARDGDARRTFAFCKPERGKEYEDHSRGP